MCSVRDVRGMVFCLVTLFIAAFTMPPVIYLSHWLSLPRPAVDIAWRMAVMAYVCGMMPVEPISSLDKLACRASPIRRTYSVAVIRRGLWRSAWLAIIAR